MDNDKITIYIVSSSSSSTDEQNIFFATRDRAQEYVDKKESSGEIPKRDLYIWSLKEGEEFL